MMASMPIDQMELPINVVPGRNPPVFRWHQTLDTPAGKRIVEHESGVPVALEVVLVQLIGITKQLMYDNAALQGQLKGLNDRIAAQGDLSKPAPVITTTPATASSRKGKG